MVRYTDAAYNDVQPTEDELQAIYLLDAAINEDRRAFIEGVGNAIRFLDGVNEYTIFVGNKERMLWREKEL